MIRVSRKGQATIPKDLRERFGIETPGKVLIREEGGKIVVEPLPSVEDREEGGKIVVEPLPSVEDREEGGKIVVEPLPSVEDREEGGKIVVEPLPSVEDREEGGKIVVEPLPSVEEMQGVHAGRYERGEVLDRLRGMNEKDKRLERERNERLDRGR
ncbi:hypothetical protein GCM10008995_02850 [Halobellus salinus]|uniref:SpoVT-AbrB domain-containing protein n=1 Tax=Halobellus salinus TaxID=931585 RepID=A0A830EJ30_9EURY|nr:AbrB/MazE/SpoVT family DNA-binding domain-containing protein [Halobellus salinus]GGI96192.1 hypothetical protein GCM10008995_02850 [Halobellus salinus]